MVDPEQGLQDSMRLLAAHPLVDEADGVQVLVQEDVERVGLVELRVRLLNSKERNFVHHDHVGRNRIERAEESLRMVPEVGQGQHEARSRAPEDGLDGALHELEDVVESPRLVQLRAEVHRSSNSFVRLKTLLEGFRERTDGSASVQVDGGARGAARVNTTVGKINETLDRKSVV